MIRRAKALTRADDRYPAPAEGVAVAPGVSRLRVSTASPVTI
jgi:hypothetical protein